MQFAKNLLIDVRNGRDTWRVILTASTFSLAASLLLVVAQQPL